MFYLAPWFFKKKGKFFLKRLQTNRGWGGGAEKLINQNGAGAFSASQSKQSSINIYLIMIKIGKLYTGDTLMLALFNILIGWILKYIYINLQDTLWIWLFTKRRGRGQYAINYPNKMIYQIYVQMSEIIAFVISIHFPFCV